MTIEFKIAAYSSTGQVHYRNVSEGNGFFVETPGIYRATNNSTFTQVFSLSMATGDVIKIELNGSEHKVYQNGTLAGSFTDSNYLTGTKVGFGGKSNTVRYDDLTISSIDTTAPSEVTNLTETHDATAINLSWTNPTDADFSHVNIYRDNVQIATNITDANHTDSGLASGTQYTYSVRTVDTSGNESTGASIIVTTDTPDTTPPAEVAGLSATTTNDSATLTWTNPIDADFSHVRILRDNVQVADNVTAETFSDTGLAQSTQYTYLVKTIDTTGNESAGVSIDANTTAPDSEVPPMLTDLTASRLKISDETGVNSLTLTFEFDMDVSAWTVNVLGVDPFTGTVADSGSSVTMGTPISAVVEWTELQQEGSNRLNIYGRTAGGTWTPYGAGYVIDCGTFLDTTFVETYDGDVFGATESGRVIDGNSDRIKFRRGLTSNLPVLDVGEIGYCTDTGDVYIGTANGNVLVNGGT
jgi:chitodextrinase